MISDPLSTLRHPTQPFSHRTKPPISHSAQSGVSLISIVLIHRDQEQLKGERSFVLAYISMSQSIMNWSRNSKAETRE